MSVVEPSNSESGSVIRSPSPAVGGRPRKSLVWDYFVFKLNISHFLKHKIELFFSIVLSIAIASCGIKKL